MTFAKYQSLFLQKYPNGETFMHDEFMHGTDRNRQKVGVVFEPNGKVYMYRGAYEDILCRIGVNVISKERFSELEARLAHLKEMDGTEDLFGGVFDYSDEIASVVSEIEKYKTDYTIV